MGDQAEPVLAPVKEEADAKKKRQIEVKIVFLKLNNINTIKEEFTADVFLRARWREPALDSRRMDADKIKWESYFEPKLTIQNNIGDVKQTIWRELEHLKTGEAYMVERRRVKGMFFEKLELEDFPFDVQDLSIMVTSECSPTDIDLVEDTISASTVNVDSFADQQEWGLYDFVRGEPRLTPNEFSSAKYKRPGFIFHCCAVRKAGFFIHNIMLVIALISSLAFATFSVDREKPQNRLQLSFTLVLTIVAFKFVASQSIPKLSYLTNLDVYILMAMWFLFGVCCWHAVVALFHLDDDLATTMDFYAFFAFLAAYVLAQSVFVLLAAVKFIRKKREMEKLEDEYQQKLDSLPADENQRRRRRYGRRRTMTTIRVQPF